MRGGEGEDDAQSGMPVGSAPAPAASEAPKPGIFANLADTAASVASKLDPRNWFSKSQTTQGTGTIGGRHRGRAHKKRTQRRRRV